MKSSSFGIRQFKWAVSGYAYLCLVHHSAITWQTTFTTVFASGETVIKALFFV